MRGVEHSRPSRFGVREALAIAVIVVLLVGIAWPLAVDQGKKRVDARVKSDLTAVHEAISEWLVSHEELPELTVDGTAVLFNGVEVAQLHDGTQLGELSGMTDTTWCITASNPDGKHAANPGYRFKAGAEKIDTGEC